MKEIMRIKQKIGRVRNVRIPGWTNVFLSEEEFLKDGITQAAIKRELDRAGKKPRRDYDYQDYGWSPQISYCGWIFEENGKLFKNVDGETEDVTPAQVAYWQAMSKLGKNNDLIL